MVGDVVLGLPALQLLESQGYELHLYGKGWASSLLGGHGWHCTPRAGKLGERIEQLRQLRQQCQQADATFDQRINTLVMPNSFSSAFEPRWAGLKPAGYARDGRSLLLKQAWQPDPPAHSLDGFWGLACRLTGTHAAPPERINLQVRPEAQRQADELLAAKGIPHGFICIVPYAAGDVDGQDKRWPDFAQFTQQLAAPGRHCIVTCPGPGEEDIARRGHPDALSLPGLRLDVYLGVLKRARLVISNDTGPAHMAAAVGTTVLSVLGPTNPDQWRPWGPQNLIAQAPNRQWPSVQDVLQRVPA
ncbi:MAG: glycosyltransferase family 9 protein [Burkholderiales bacterium]|nr:glycosyltransferase family 9 protein [Burkholderiales bacterium]